MKDKLDLMDWKNIETMSEQMIRESEKAIVINTILLDKAIIKIKELGGKTNAEEEEQAKQELKRSTV